MRVENDYKIIHMDEFIDQLLRNERFLGVSLPRMAKRCVLEEDEELEPYQSKLKIDENEEKLAKKQAIMNKYGDSSQSDSEIENPIVRKRDKKYDEKKSEAQIDPNDDDYWLNLRK